MAEWVGWWVPEWMSSWVMSGWTVVEVSVESGEVLIMRNTEPWFLWRNAEPNAWVPTPDPTLT